VSKKYYVIMLVLNFTRINSILLFEKIKNLRTQIDTKDEMNFLTYYSSLTFLIFLPSKFFHFQFWSF